MSLIHVYTHTHTNIQHFSWFSWLVPHKFTYSTYYVFFISSLTLPCYVFLRYIPSI